MHRLILAACAAVKTIGWREIIEDILGVVALGLLFYLGMLIGWVLE